MASAGPERKREMGGTGPRMEGEFRRGEEEKVEGKWHIVWRVSVGTLN